MHQHLQSALLPPESPDLQGLEFAEEVQAARRVRGDFYTYVELDGGKWAIVAVDVCGHGMGGAVTVLRFSETRRYETRGRTEPDDVCRLYLLLLGPANFTSAHPVCRTAVSTSTSIASGAPSRNGFSVRPLAMTNRDS
jgi:hypothetical protein